MSHSFPLFAVTTETRLLARIRGTETTVLQLVEEEKVLINAEVVQFSRTVGFALEDAKGKMMEKVAEGWMQMTLSAAGPRLISTGMTTRMSRRSGLSKRRRAIKIPIMTILTTTTDGKSEGGTAPLLTGR